MTVEKLKGSETDVYQQHNASFVSAAMRGRLRRIGTRR
jgi:hypothetical protein